VSTRTATAKRRGRSRRRGPSRATLLRRRLMWLAGVLTLAVVVAYAVAPYFDRAVQEVVLPLKHEDVIRQQAQEKDLDPALIAGVIYTESHFRHVTSHAGAVGLMQILPTTADYIAGKSGGTQFEQGDLATPQLNIAYGSWYLSYLMHKYRDSEVLALAAYNAGPGKLDQWLQTAAARGERFKVADHIPFAETRGYVEKVLAARAQYRREYPRELGI
jgi:soluble lytic murein transglycosylase